METMGARVVNELFINHLFSLALSLHGGTESLTYPYGTPNHLENTQVPKIPMKYQEKNGEIKANPLSKKFNRILKKFRGGAFEMTQGKSTNPPDYNSIKSIAETASDHSTNNPKYKYKTGDMNGMVYSVTGAMEDWAYSGSWEGPPIITQPCTPKTYNKYHENKTNYNNYKDALKSIMFLLEVSNEKTPEQKLLGRKNLNCLINLRSNAFFNTIAPNKKICLGEYVDGYVSRIIRLSLTLIDLLKPYVTLVKYPIDNGIQVDWTVGGAIDVNKSFILYNYFDKEPEQNTVQMLRTSKDINVLKGILKKTTPEVSGKAVWNTDYSADDRFTFTFNEMKSNGNYLVFVIVAYVDNNWSLKNHPDPDVNPKTHIANLRTNSGYVASNGTFKLTGKEFFKSPVKVIPTDGRKRKIKKIRKIKK
jgi:hypothetical protein